MRYEILPTQSGDFVVCDAGMAPVARETSYLRALRHIRTLQGLPTCHDALTDEGAYVWTHHGASYDDDDGDAENGPDPHFCMCPAFDQYEGDTHILIFQDGKLVHVQEINWDEYRFFNTLTQYPQGYCFVRMRDEDGTWYAGGDGCWTQQRDQALLTDDDTAHQIANRFNATNHNRIVGKAVVVDTEN